MRASLRWLDRTTTASIQGKPRALRPFMHTLSLLGSPAFIVPPVGLIGLWHVVYGNAAIGTALLLACLACFISGLIKFGPKRPRPDTAYARHMFFKTYSFPSGHAFSSAVIYGLIACFGYMFLAYSQAIPLSIVLLLLVVAIGFSRIYLGAHYVLDVLGGWLFAGGVLIALVDFLAKQ
jgi:membrane-associated phospholipid phosphatase